MSIVPAFFNRTESIRPLFDDVDVSEIAVNGPGIVWAGRKGMRFMERVDTPVLNRKHVAGLCRVGGASLGSGDKRAAPTPRGLDTFGTDRAG